MGKRSVSLLQLVNHSSHLLEPNEGGYLEIFVGSASLLQLYLSIFVLTSSSIC